MTISDGVKSGSISDSFFTGKAAEDKPEETFSGTVHDYLLLVLTQLSVLRDAARALRGIYNGKAKEEIR